MAFASRPAAVALFVSAAVTALAVDLLRLRRPAFHRGFDLALGPMLRASEATRLTGATTLALGFAAAVVLFPAPAAMGGLLYAGLADAASAVIGRGFGRHRIRAGRTLEGSCAFFGVALLIGIGPVGIGPVDAALVALALTLLELLPLPFDDNLLLPTAGALALSIASGLG